MERRAVDSSAEDDSNNVVSRPTISNKDNGRIRSYKTSKTRRGEQGSQ